MKKLAANNMKRAEKALNDFLKELKANGFTKGITKHLNLAWQKEKLLIENMTKGLKDIKFDYKDPKFIELSPGTKIFRFKVEINGEETSIFVQPLKDYNGQLQSSWDPNTHFGIIPTKLIKFNKEEAARIKARINAAAKTVNELEKEIKKGEAEIDKIEKK